MTGNPGSASILETKKKKKSCHMKFAGAMNLQDAKDNK
jgi:hypothetical protein